MQHDGQLPAAFAGGHPAEAAAHGHAELLQRAAVDAGQGIGPFGEDELVVGRFQAEPVQAGRVVPGKVELRPGG